MWKRENKTNYKTSIFKSENEVKEFLTNLFHEVNNQQEYNIYLHQINDYYDDVRNLYGEKAIKSRISRILKSDFSISSYSALSGTAMLIGSTKNLDVNKLLNYEYYKNLDCVAVCVIAIPKDIKVNDEIIEYSSFEGKDSWHFPEELTKEYLKHRLTKPELHHYKCCMFDAIKRYKELPQCYMLGVLQTEKVKNKYSFIRSYDHLSRCDEEKVKKHDKLIENYIVDLYDKYNTKDLKKIIVSSYIDAQNYYDQVNDFEV